MPLPLHTRTATDRSKAARGCWVAMVCRAYMRPAKVPDEPGSVQSDSNANRVRIPFRIGVARGALLVAARWQAPVASRVAPAWVTALHRGRGSGPRLHRALESSASG